ncbi:MAG: polysaccharide deacetylase family protein [Fimbriimonas ginsengisoli]|uniref:Polysaccharide deacetylase family protein n=1 Tax=Fimbriimonas ginsengisoli TaxID=1005039 RepID=A0A931LU62_FIMGI|nr:polysaccharide deacetylase family protein [Fimbriimonas ginsengisoli]
MPDSDGSPWQEGKRWALSLTYDGAWPEHLSEVWPLLRDVGLKATFFVSPTRLLDDPRAWQALAAEGHEIGSHSLFGASDGGTLFNWTLPMVQADLRMTQRLLKGLVGVEPESFALPGWSTASGEGDYLPVVQEHFRFVRTDRREVITAAKFDPKALASNPLEEADAPAALQVARLCGGWQILRIGRLGGQPGRCDSFEHERLVRDWAKMHDLWIAPVREVGSRLLACRHGLSAEGASVAGDP